jgi:hypothetical protein
MPGAACARHLGAAHAELISTITAWRCARDPTPETTRIEFRVPAADTNPHLALALALGAGLWGIENKIALPERATGDVRAFLPEGLRALPRTLLEAAERLAASAVAKELFGAAFVDHFVMTRKHEDASLHRAVSAAERARYLENLVTRHGRAPPRQATNGPRGADISSRNSRPCMCTRLM